MELGFVVVGRGLVMWFCGRMMMSLQCKLAREEVDSVWNGLRPP